MGFRVAGSETSRTPEQQRTSVKMSRRGGVGGEMGEMQKLFEEMMGGEEGFEEIEGLEDIDWDEMWNSFMGEELGGEQEQQGSRQPTMFGSPTRYSGGKPPGMGFNYY